MARKQIVSRTVVGVEATCMVVDTVAGELSNKTYTLSGQYKIKDKDGNDTGAYDDKKILKALKKNYETDEIKIVNVVATAECNKLYGMWEEDFIANAMLLDPVTRKPIGVSDEGIDVDAE